MTTKHLASKSITESVPNWVKKPKATNLASQCGASGKKVATVAQKIEALNWYHANGKNQTKTAKYFNEKWPDLELKQPKVSD